MKVNVRRCNEVTLVRTCVYAAIYAVLEVTGYKRVARQRFGDEFIKLISDLNERYGGFGVEVRLCGDVNYILGRNVAMEIESQLKIGRTAIMSEGQRNAVYHVRNVMTAVICTAVVTLSDRRVTKAKLGEVLDRYYALLSGRRFDTATCSRLKRALRERFDYDCEIE